jgi:superfamily II DNA or RNA helicase
MLVGVHSSFGTNKNEKNKKTKTKTKKQKNKKRKKQKTKEKKKKKENDGLVACLCTVTAPVSFGFMATTEGPLAYADRVALSVAPVNSTHRVPFFIASGRGFVYPAHYTIGAPNGPTTTGGPTTGGPTTGGPKGPPKEAPNGPKGPTTPNNATKFQAPKGQSKFQVTDIVFTGTLRDEQRVALASIVESVERTGSALCEMRTGFGKTVVALALCGAMRVRALVLVHTHTLLAQWVERAREFTGVEPPTARGSAALERCVASDAPLVIAMIQTVVAATPSTSSSTPSTSSSTAPSSVAPSSAAPSSAAPSSAAPTALRGRFDLVIYDEVHHVCARAFSRAIFALRSPLAVGLSATVERADGLGVALGWFFGPSIRTSGSSIRATVERLEMRDHGVEVTSVYNKALRRDAVNFSRLVSDLASCAPRTEQIAARVRALLAEGRVALVVCSRVTHCAAMRDALAPYRVRVLAGGKGQDDDAPFDAIVGTSGTVGEGFDEPRLDTLVFATPVVAVTQAIGRILRRRNAMPPLVVDPVDPIAVCTGQWFKRVAAYKAAGHTITLR